MTDGVDYMIIDSFFTDSTLSRISLTSLTNFYCGFYVSRFTFRHLVKLRKTISRCNTRSNDVPNCLQLVLLGIAE